MRPKGQGWRTAARESVFALLLIPGLLLGLVPYLIYALSHYSANYYLRKGDFAVVQLYLDHFESIYPELIGRFVQLFGHPNYAQRPGPNALKFWPARSREHAFCCIPGLGSYHETEFTFSSGARMFACLESNGYPRSTLYEFLRQQVEAKIPGIAESERAEFRRAMSKVCSGNITEHVSNFLSDSSGRGFTLPSSARQRQRVIEVRRRSIGWIVERSHALVVPMDSASYNCMKRLASETGLWRVLENTEELPQYETYAGLVLDLR